MNIKKNITIELSEEDVKNIIADYLNNDGYNVTADDVVLSVDSKLEGYGPMEHIVNYFKGASIKCKEK